MQSRADADRHQWRLASYILGKVMSLSAKSAQSGFPTRLLSVFFMLLLGTAIFSWGLHSKLSLYEAPPVTQATLPIAKLLSEQERPTADQMERQLHAPPPAPTEVQILFSGISIQPTPNAPNVREEEHVAVPLVFCFSGPSLLRPPPVHAA